MADRSLYDTDFALWSAEQAAAIRAAASSGANLPLDWENLAEEIESLGGALKRELASRMAVVIEHLLKLQVSPSSDPRDGWLETVGRERLEIEGVVEDNPSLRGALETCLPGAHRKGRKFAQLSLDREGEMTPERWRRLSTITHSVEQVVGDWLPPLPGA